MTMPGESQTHPEPEVISCEFLTCDDYFVFYPAGDWGLNRPRPPLGWMEFGESRMRTGSAYWCPVHTSKEDVRISDELWEKED